MLAFWSDGGRGRRCCWPTWIVSHVWWIQHWSCVYLRVGPNDLRLFFHASPTHRELTSTTLRPHNHNSININNNNAYNNNNERYLNFIYLASMFTLTTSMTTSMTTMTTTSITVTVYDGCWGSRCLGYGYFILFYFFTFHFFLAKSTFTIRNSTTMMNDQLPHIFFTHTGAPAPGWTGLKMQCFSSPKGIFLLFVLFCFFLFY